MRIKHMLHFVFGMLVCLIGIVACCVIKPATVFAQATDTPTPTPDYVNVPIYHSGYCWQCYYPEASPGGGAWMPSPETFTQLFSGMNQGILGGIVGEDQRLNLHVEPGVPGMLYLVRKVPAKGTVEQISMARFVAPLDGNLQIDMKELLANAPGGQYMLVACQDSCSPNSTPVDLNTLGVSALGFELPNRVPSIMPVIPNAMNPAIGAILTFDPVATRTNVKVEWRKDDRPLQVSDNPFANLMGNYMMYSTNNGGIGGSAPSSNTGWALLYPPRAAINRFIPGLHLPEEYFSSGEYKIDIYYMGYYESTLPVEIPLQ